MRLAEVIMHQVRSKLSDLRFHRHDVLAVGKTDMPHVSEKHLVHRLCVIKIDPRYDALVILAAYLKEGLGQHSILIVAEKSAVDIYSAYVVGILGAKGI